MMKINIMVIALGMFISTHIAAGISPVAIIEEIDTNNSALSFMDYVTEGHVIQLGNKGTLVIGYLNSCRRETITGGTVTIGAKQSQVNKGQLLREDVECDGGNATLTGQQAVTSGALATRGPSKLKTGIGKADLTIFGTSPVLLVKQANADITIERIDQRSKVYTYHLSNKHLDLADKKLSLELGGLYRVTVKNGLSKTFKVDKYAEQGKISIVSRLIDL